MRKIFLSLFIIPFGLSLSVLILLINIRIFAANPQNLKTIAEKSNIYSLITGNLRDNFVRDNNITLDQGQSMEIINETISDTSIKYAAEKSIDQLYTAIRKQQPQIITLDCQLLYGSIAKQTGVTLNQDLIDQNQIKIDLTQGTTRKIFQNFDLLIYFVGICLVILLLTIILLARNNKERLISFLISLGLVLLILSAILVMLYFFPGKISAYSILNLEAMDVRIRNGLGKIVLASTQVFAVYVVIEITIILIIESVFIYLISSKKRPKIEILGFK
ncbi:MAG: hypothetical protein WCO23_05395 [bacterium]